MLRFKFRVIFFYLISYCSDFTLTALKSFPNLRACFVSLCPLCPLLSLLASLFLSLRESPKVKRSELRPLLAKRDRFSISLCERPKVIRITKGLAKRAREATPLVIRFSLCTRARFATPKVSRKARSESPEVITFGEAKRASRSASARDLW